MRGQADEYRAIALGVDPSILDVYVPDIPVTPGTVNVWLLVGPIDGAGAGELAGNSGHSANRRGAGCSERRRPIGPLCDTVVVEAVTEVDYAIVATVELYADADPVSVEPLVNQAAALFAKNLSSRIQRDIVPEEIIAALTLPGVYRVTVSSPSSHAADCRAMGQLHGYHAHVHDVDGVFIEACLS